MADIRALPLARTGDHAALGASCPAGLSGLGHAVTSATRPGIFSKQKPSAFVAPSLEGHQIWKRRIPSCRGPRLPHSDTFARHTTEATPTGVGVARAYANKATGLSIPWQPHRLAAQKANPRCTVAAKLASPAAADALKSHPRSAGGPSSRGKICMSRGTTKMQKKEGKGRAAILVTGAATLEEASLSTGIRNLPKDRWGKNAVGGSSERSGEGSCGLVDAQHALEQAWQLPSVSGKVKEGSRTNDPNSLVRRVLQRRRQRKGTSGDTPEPISDGFVSAHSGRHPEGVSEPHNGSGPLPADNLMTDGRLETESRAAGRPFDLGSQGNSELESAGVIIPFPGIQGGDDFVHMPGGLRALGGQRWSKEEKRGRRRSLELVSQRATSVLVRSGRRKRRLSLGSRVVARASATSVASLPFSHGSKLSTSDPAGACPPASALLTSNQKGPGFTQQEDDSMEGSMLHVQPQQSADCCAGSDVASPGGICVVDINQECGPRVRAKQEDVGGGEEGMEGVDALLQGYGWKGASRLEWDASRGLLGEEEERKLLALLEAGKALMRVREGLQQGVGREPREEEWAQAAGCTLGQLKRTLGCYRAARNKLVMHNVGLVVSVAKLYAALGNGVDFPSLCQRGIRGLFDAADRFHMHRNCRFSTLASVCIRTVITREIARSMHVRAPSYSSYKFLSIQKVERELTTRFNRSPSEEELARESGTSVRQLRLIRGFFRAQPGSLHADHTGTGTEVGDMVEDWEGEWRDVALLPAQDEKGVMSVDPTAVRYALDDMIDSLQPKEAVVIRQRFGLDGYGARSLADIGRTLLVSRQMAQKYEARALAKLKLPERAELFQSRLAAYCRLGS